MHLVDGLDHVHRDADGARLVGDGAAHRLADPPGGVGRELVAALVLELLDRAHEADVPLLDQVEEAEAAVGVALGDRDDEPEVGLDEAPLAFLRLHLAAPDAREHVAQQLRRHADVSRSDLLHACGAPRGWSRRPRPPAPPAHGTSGWRRCARPSPRPGCGRVLDDLRCAGARAAPRAGGWSSCSASTMALRLLQLVDEAGDVLGADLGLHEEPRERSAR